MRQDGGTTHRSTLIALAVIGVCTCITYFNGLEGGFLWDDGPLIVTNEYVHSFEHLSEALTSSFWNLSSSVQDISETYKQVYRPVVTFAYLVQYQLFSGSPLGFHVVSLVLHTLCAFLVFVLLRRRLPVGPGATVGAAVGALFFALHPSRVESVAWVSGSTDLWMSVLLLSGFWLWERRTEGTLFSFAAAVLFCLAFLSKETAIVVPALLLADNVERGPEISWKPWAMVTAIVGFCLVFRASMVPVRPSVGGSSLFETLTRFVGSIGYYAEMTVWPWVPSAQRAVRYHSCAGDLAVPPHVLIAGAIVLALAVVGVALSLRRSMRSPWLADFAWFFLPLLPIANLFDLHASVLVSERFLYLPLFGVASMVGRLVASAFRRRVSLGLVITGASSLGLVACVLVSMTHVQHFQSSRALWEYQHRLDPENPEPLRHLATFYYLDRDFDSALELLQRGYAGAVERCDKPLALRFILRTASQILSTTPDTDQETLQAIRTMYDGLAEGRPLDLRTRDLSATFTVPRNGLSQVLADVEFFQLPRAIAWMRTLDLEGAQNQLEIIVAANVRNDKAWRMLITVYARRGRWGDALIATRDAAEQLQSEAAMEGLKRKVEQAQELASRPIATDRDRVIRDAQLQVLLGAPEAARRLLQAELEASPTDVALVMAYARTMVADRRFKAAEDVVIRAQSLDQGRQGMWMQIRQGIVEAKDQAAGRAP